MLVYVLMISWKLFSLVIVGLIVFLALILVMFEVAKGTLQIDGLPSISVSDPLPTAGPGGNGSLTDPKSGDSAAVPTLNPNTVLPTIDLVDCRQVDENGEDIFNFGKIERDECMAKVQQYQQEQEANVNQGQSQLTAPNGGYQIDPTLKPIQF